MTSFLTVFLIFIGLSLMIVLHECGHFLMARFFGLRVDEFGFGLPPRLWGKKIGETIYSINWLPFGGFVKIFGEDGAEALINKEERGGDALDAKRSFRSAKPLKKALIVAAGVIMNFLFGWLLLWFVLVIGTPQALLIVDVREGSPAFHGGLMANDVVTEMKVNYESLIFSPETGYGVEDAVQFINDHRGEAIQFRIQRGGEITESNVVPRVNPPEGEGALGIAMSGAGLTPQNPFSAVILSFKEALNITKAIALGIIDFIARIITGLPVEGVVGPIGIINLAITSGRMGLVYVVQLLALISLNLAVLNIIPFPALDGGRLLFVIIEKIKGSPLSIKTESFINGIGFIALLILMVLITLKDVSMLL